MTLPHLYKDWIARLIHCNRNVLCVPISFVPHTIVGNMYAETCDQRMQNLTFLNLNLKYSNAGGRVCTTHTNEVSHLGPRQATGPLA